MPADLKSIPLFHGVQESELRALADRTVTRSYPKQAIIVSEGDESDSLYLILAGRVKVYLADENGKELILAIKGPGIVLGGLAPRGAPPPRAGKPPAAGLFASLLPPVLPGLLGGPP